MRKTFLFLIAAVAGLAAFAGVASADVYSPAPAPIVRPGYLSGYFYAPNYGTPTAASGTVGATNTVYCAAGSIGRAVTIKALGAYFSTGGTISVSFAVYRDNNGAPGSLVDYALSNATLSNATAYAPTVNNTTDPLAPGTYWWCEAQYGATLVMTGLSAVQSGQGALVGAASLANASSIVSNASQVTGITCANGGGCNVPAWTGTTGSSGAFAWPDFTSIARSNWTNATTTVVPMMMFQVN